MTTNRMGLEQTLSDEVVAAVATLNHLGYAWQGGEQWKPPVGLPPPYINDDRAELEAYRKASKEPVAYIGVNMLNDMRDESRQSGRVWINDIGGGECIPLYAAPPIQDIAVPDEVTFEQAMLEVHGLSPAEAFQKAWNKLRGKILKSVTNEP